MSFGQSPVPAGRPSQDELDDLLPAFDAGGHPVRPHGPWQDTGPASDEQCDGEIARAAIGRLPEPYQSIDRLHDNQGLSKSDAARHLDVPRDGVARMVHRARGTLATLLDPHFREDSDFATHT